MTADYLPLLRALIDLNLPIRVFGGFAEDALLAGTITRPHDDVDLIVMRDDLDEGLRAFAALDFDPPDIRFEPAPGRPLVMGTVRGDLNLELSIADADEDGTPWFAVPDQTGRLQRITMTEDMFAWPPVRLEGIPIRTVSPLALYQIRAGLMIVGAMGPPRGKDLVSQAALRDRFFPGVPEEQLRPRIEPSG